MNARRVGLALAFVLLFIPGRAHPHDDEQRSQVGHVQFANSCGENIQSQLQAAVAMLHSFWYSAAEETFRDVLVHDRECTIANWGIAAILMSGILCHD